MVWTCECCFRDIEKYSEQYGCLNVNTEYMQICMDCYDTYVEYRLTTKEMIDLVRIVFIAKLTSELSFSEHFDPYELKKSLTQPIDQYKFGFKCIKKGIFEHFVLYDTLEEAIEKAKLSLRQYKIGRHFKKGVNKRRLQCLDRQFDTIVKKRRTLKRIVAKESCLNTVYYTLWFLKPIVNKDVARLIATKVFETRNDYNLWKQ